MKNKPAQKGFSAIIIIVVLLIVGLFLVVGAVALFFILRSKTLTPTPSKETKVVEPQVANDSNPDHYYDPGTSLPFSRKFTDEIIANAGSRKLGVQEGYGAEVIAVGGNNAVYNFSILKPLDWDRKALEPGRYESQSPDGRGAIGVLLLSKDGTKYANYTTCSAEVGKIYQNYDGFKVVSQKNVKVDGQIWDRVIYTVKKGDGPIGYGTDQCLKTDSDIVDAYVFLDQSNYDKMQDQVDVILDDFYFREI